ncbi:ATP-grasp domain-containing protein [Caminibacter sp.]
MGTSINLLVTTAGGSGIYPVIEAVKSSKYDINLVLVDASKIAGALYEVDKSYIIPMVSEKEFFCVFKEIIKKEKITHLLSFLDEELNFLATKKDELDKLEVKHLIPNLSPLLKTWDKIETFKSLKEYMPKSFILEENLDLKKIWEELNGNLLLKPALSRGGRGIIIPEDFEEFEFFAKKFLKKQIPYLISKFIQGKEYNITTLFDKDGNVVYAIPRWKFEERIIKSGSKASVIVENKKVVNFALEVLNKIGLNYGFNNVEVIENDEGIFLLEINGGRIAAQDMNIVKAGVNFVDLFIDIVENRKLTKVTYKKGVCNIKTLRDIWVDFEDIEKKEREYEKNLNSCRSS